MKNTAIAMLATAVCIFVSCSSAQEERMSEKMVRSEMFRAPDATYLDEANGRLKWNYTPGLEFKALLDYYKTYGEEDVYNYVESWYDRIVNEDGTITGYNVEKYSIDLICPGVSLFYLYDKTGKEKYRKAIDLVKSQLDGHPRTEAGAFWHKQVYPYQVWLDGVYMGMPFYTEYVNRYYPEEEKAAAYADIINEFTVAAEKTFDPETGLYRHAWDESKSMFWCNPETGQSAHCWGRALGWYCMAVIDVLDLLPENVEGREKLIEILNHICKTLPEYGETEYGPWYQVLDSPEREGNYLEATCTAMFTFTYLKASRMGYIDESYKEYAKKVYQAMVDEFIVTDEEGHISLTRCCMVGGLGGSNNRMGDFAYYLSEPIRDNDVKGVGPFIWASLEMERK